MQNLAHAFCAISYPPNTRILTEGQDNRNLYVIRKGNVRHEKEKERYHHHHHHHHPSHDDDKPTHTHAGGVDGGAVLAPPQGQGGGGGGQYRGGDASSGGGGGGGGGGSGTMKTYQRAMHTHQRNTQANNPVRTRSTVLSEQGPGSLFGELAALQEVPVAYSTSSCGVVEVLFLF